MVCMATGTINGEPVRFNGYSGSHNKFIRILNAIAIRLHLAFGRIAQTS